VSIFYLALVERLELLVSMTAIAMLFGLLMLIRAREGKSERALALAFVATSLLTDLLFWRLT
jgi:hypothetical protein